MTNNNYEGMTRAELDREQHELRAEITWLAASGAPTGLHRHALTHLEREIAARAVKAATA